MGLEKLMYGPWDQGNDLLASLQAAFNSLMRSDDSYSDALPQMTSTMARTVAAMRPKLKLVDKANEKLPGFATFASSQLVQLLNNDCALQGHRYLDSSIDDFISWQQWLVRRYVTNVQRRQPTLWQALLKTDERVASVHGSYVAAIVLNYWSVQTRLSEVAVLLTELSRRWS